MEVRHREFANVFTGPYRDGFAPPALSEKNAGFLAIEIAVGMTVREDR